MVTQRITGGSNQIGILLLDRARINRDDIAVPGFGLLAWLMFELAERRRGPRGAYFGAGVLVGCASLSHMYGGFWLPALGAVLVLRRGLGGLRSGAAGAMVAGLATTWIPWVLFILSGWPDYVGQMRFVSPRFRLLDLNFYLGNVFSEAGPLALGWAWRVL
jgi:4-amino-4-deoxy-L-arabinose transferase-like glycosyltransferase